MPSIPIHFFTVVSYIWVYRPLSTVQLCTLVHGLGIKCILYAKYYTTIAQCMVYIRYCMLYDYLHSSDTAQQWGEYIDHIRKCFSVCGFSLYLHISIRLYDNYESI